MAEIGDGEDSPLLESDSLSPSSGYQQPSLQLLRQQEQHEWQLQQNKLAEDEATAVEEAQKTKQQKLPVIESQSIFHSPLHVQTNYFRSPRLERKVRAKPNSSVVSTPSSAERSGKKSGKRLKSDGHAAETSDSPMLRDRSDFRPKISIPQNISSEEYAAQCIQAAVGSRLSPYTLHASEYALLRDHINHNQVTTYLNIRNGILRLWHRNPLISVTREEAAGCAKDHRFFNLADVAFEWLLRNGYINFGCMEVPRIVPIPHPTRRKRNIIVIGAGISGLGCTRQLEGMFQQLGDQFSKPEEIPNITILEARGRLGGRIYSHPLKQIAESGVKATVDLGGQIITGFEGNPIATIFRSQLALPYHLLHDKMLFYDIDGRIVEKSRDALVENLYNDVLDRVSIFKHIPTSQHVVEGDRDLIDVCKDPHNEGGQTIARIEENGVETLPTPSSYTTDQPQSPFLASVDKFTGKAQTATGSSAIMPPTELIQKDGWKLKKSGSNDKSIKLLEHKNSQKNNILGKTMDSVLEQYRELIDLSPQDLRIFNWHHANLEYANATKIDKLSLEHWDQDDGNEFSGGHAMIVGGYSQVPRGLFLSPTQLNVKTRHIVKKIRYMPGRTHNGVTVECENGAKLYADKVIVTLPLGVLKESKAMFEPSLPTWKTDAIDRLGYGLLNKVVLVYDKPFWDVDNDMIGTLREAHGDPTNQSSYERNRGRFYMFWNCIKVVNRPVLVALMAGEAADQTEIESDHQLVDEATRLLRGIFPNKDVPLPSESIITRWRADPFSRGTYSYISPGATGEDYNLIAKPVDDLLFFAGEASCQTHPATVHGAYISGLRAASEIVDSILGPIQISSPLVPLKVSHDRSNSSSSSFKRSAEDSYLQSPNNVKKIKLDDEKEMNRALSLALGERPSKPNKSAVNPFLLYQKDYWFVCKAKCDELSRQVAGDDDAKATRNEVRAALGQMWRDSTDEEKRPYLESTIDNKATNAIAAEDFKSQLAEWDAAAETFKQTWRDGHHSTQKTMHDVESVVFTNGARKRKRTSVKASIDSGLGLDDDGSQI